MRREAQNLLLLLVGATVLWVTLDGVYLRYVKPGLYPFLVASGIGFVGLALVAIARDVRRGTAVADSDHDHDHGTGRAVWLLLIPVAVLLVITPPPLGAEAAVTSSPVEVVPRVERAAPPQQRPFPPLPDEPAPRLSFVDLMNRAYLDSTHSLEGREITISGFVMRPDDLALEKPDTAAADLARVVITCCVADARYVRVHLEGMTEVIEDDAWLEVRGVVRTDATLDDSDHTPTLIVTHYERVPAPDSRYERTR
ncbi:TIGR03943 family putative permease subunit [Nocardia arizonensis]|uniref:TIGR03943 family putative permease subunit n=1 Tax=Nocardia arizonensis TaxID=1141647 RepID=UPI0006D032AA|nr:TIGR03943 family protein [Nocardia arizonensis]